MSQEHYERFGRLVRDTRLALGLSIDGASAKARMSPITWARIENGLRVRPLSIAALDDVLGWDRGTALINWEERVGPELQVGDYATKRDPLREGLTDENERKLEEYAAFLRHQQEEGGE